MGTDRIRFNQCGGFRVDALGHQQVCHRHAQELAKAAILMHTDHRDVLTAVGAPTTAGRAFTTGNVRNNRNLLTIMQMVYIFPQTNNLATYFVA
jgi:hypothetical protein